ncbi:MAG: hypothetical protein ACN6NY_11335 [Acinetobacter faecalis]|uniref:Uncharacterized protein n=1 Tax=Acinetobacter faecalis TaxID=2665161 RepID=A0A6L6GE77_9GAMM|nr:hypothetical protein [Acinetobacter faecalis]MTD10993.1 hypothetical protein [Acinetobacter faecalis]
MTLLEILDTAIKIGLGALITGIITYFNQKANLKAQQNKENKEFNRNLLTKISSDIEEINHLILKIWAIFDFEIKKPVLDKEVISDRLSPLRENLFDDFNLLSKNEGLLLLYDYKDQQEILRRYGELVGAFNSYTCFRKESVSIEKTAEYKANILETRKQLYQSLNKAIPK